MMRYLRPPRVFVIVGLVTGLLIGVFVIEVRPAVVGWFFGAGLGLMGGAFVAAVTSGQAVISGPSSRAGHDPLDDYLRAPSEGDGSDEA